MTTIGVRSKLVTALVIVACTFALVATAAAQGQGGPRAGGPPAGGPEGRGGGGAGAIMYLERAWTAVSFQLGATPEQIEALAPTFASELKTRNEGLKRAMEAQDWQAAMLAVTTCQTALQDKLGEVLTPEQWTTLEELMSVQMMGGVRGGGGGAAGRGGRGGGGQN